MSSCRPCRRTFAPKEHVQSVRAGGACLPSFVNEEKRGAKGAEDEFTPPRKETQKREPSQMASFSEHAAGKRKAVVVVDLCDDSDDEVAPSPSLPAPTASSTAESSSSGAHAVIDLEALSSPPIDLTDEDAVAEWELGQDLLEISTEDFNYAQLAAAGRRRERRRQRREETGSGMHAADETVDLTVEPDDLLSELREQLATLVSKHRAGDSGERGKKKKGAPPRPLPLFHNPKSQPGEPLYERFISAWAAVPNKKIKLVFHGTPADNIESICTNGLDPARRNGQAYGPGEYFGAAMDVSKGYCRSGRHMLIFAVLLDKSGLTVSNKQMVVVNKAEHQLPLAVVTMSGKPFEPSAGWHSRLSCPHDTSRAQLAQSAQHAASISGLSSLAGGLAAGAAVSALAFGGLPALAGGAGVGLAAGRLYATAAPTRAARPARSRPPPRKTKAAKKK